MTRLRLGTKQGTDRLAAGRLALLIAIFVGIPFVMGIGYYRVRPWQSDFLLYYRDARVGWVYGWSHLYDLGAWDAITRQLGIHSTDPNSGSLSLPLLSWLVAPYALLPMPLAYGAWLTTLGALAVLAWRLAAPFEALGKWSQLGLLAIFLPFIFGLTLGSAIVIAFAAVAASWWLSRRQRPWLAGLVLMLTLVRPQVALLVPICLLLAGQLRVFFGFVTGGAAVAALTLLTIPFSSLITYAATMRGVASHPKSWEVASDLTVTSLHPAALAMAAVVLVALATMAVALLAKRTTHADTIALTAGLLGSLLVTPYLHAQDLTMLLLAMWLWLGWLPAKRWPLVLIPVAAVANFEMSIHTPLMALLEASWLAILLITRIQTTRASALPKAA